MTGPMSVFFGPLRHLVRPSDLVAIGAKVGTARPSQIGGF